MSWSRRDFSSRVRNNSNKCPKNEILYWNVHLDWRETFLSAPKLDDGMGLAASEEESGIYTSLLKLYLPRMSLLLRDSSSSASTFGCHVMRLRVPSVQLYSYQNINLINPHPSRLLIMCMQFAQIEETIVYSHRVQEMIINVSNYKRQMHRLEIWRLNLTVTNYFPDHIRGNY